MKGINDLKTIDSCYLLMGEDDCLREKFIRNLKQTVLSAQDDMMNLVQLEGKDVSALQIIEACETMPFFADKKMVFVVDSGLVKAGKKEETEKLVKWLSNLPSYVVLVFSESEVDKRNQLYKKIKTEYTVNTFVYPGEEQALSILTGIARDRGAIIERGVLNYFVRSMPENLTYMMNEFEKLLDYAKGEVITTMHINEVCVFSLEQQVFQLVKEVVNKQAANALQIYNTLILRKESPVGVLVLIARQYRVILQVKYLMKNQSSEKLIASEVGIPYFVVRDTLKQAEKYNFKQLEQILEYCLESDVALKTGKLEPIKCVELLIMKCIYISEIER
ncbi:MAG: DNA polymerase III subunit delta [Cellulosilyticaceae bacterium]